jgi:hypothetical protein
MIKTLLHCRLFTDIPILLFMVIYTTYFFDKRLYYLRVLSHTPELCITKIHTAVLSTQVKKDEILIISTMYEESRPVYGCLFAVRGYNEGYLFSTWVST